MAGDANNAEAPRICKSIIGSRAAVLEEMSKKISLLFATDVIGRSTFGPRVFRGWSEVSDEMTNADRVCSPRLRSSGAFAGLFGAAPSVALATLGLTIVTDGKFYAAAEGRSMIAGAIAVFVRHGGDAADHEIQATRSPGSDLRDPRVVRLRYGIVMRRRPIKRKCLQSLDKIPDASQTTAGAFPGIVRDRAGYRAPA